jgi:leader peptidase (prepilin peptidase) / N-methyltransferase
MWPFWTLWFIWGSVFGSFLNVCIHRLPRELSIIKPRSRCPRCERQLRWFDNIPIVSFIILRARCRGCGKPISWLYPFIEIFAGVWSVIVFHYFGLNLVGFVYIAFVYALIVGSFIDLEFQIIPDEITLGGLVAGIALSFLIPAIHGTDSRFLALGLSLLGMLVGGGTLLVTGMIGDVIFRKESMGGGDIKLLAMAGSILGWKAVTITYFISPVIALIPGIFVLMFKRTHVIPYGPFLSIGLIISLFFGDEILRISGMEQTVQLLWEHYTIR